MQSTQKKQFFFDIIMKNFNEILEIDQNCKMIISGANPYKLIKEEGKVSFEYKSNYGIVIHFNIGNKEKFKKKLNQIYR